MRFMERDQRRIEEPVNPVPHVPDNELQRVSKGDTESVQPLIRCIFVN